MHPVYIQGRIRAVPPSLEDLHTDSLSDSAYATPVETRHEEARAPEPKEEDRQARDAKSIDAAEEGNKPQRVRSRPHGPREQAPAVRRTATRREINVRQADEPRAEAEAAENKPQGPRPLPSELGRRSSRREADVQYQQQGQEEKYHRPGSSPSSPREPELPTRSREPDSDVANVLNAYHFRHSFYDRYDPFDIETDNHDNNNRSQSMETEWSYDGHGRQYVNKQKSSWRKRLGNLKQRLKRQKARVVRAIQTADAGFRGLGGRRS